MLFPFGGDSLGPWLDVGLCLTMMPPPPPPDFCMAMLTPLLRPGSTLNDAPSFPTANTETIACVHGRLLMAQLYAHD